jgi:hypothetical protein
MPQAFRSTSGAMTDETQQGPDVSRWALPASAVIHLLCVALLLFGLPAFPDLRKQEQVVKVDLVPPPKPAEKAPAKPPSPAVKPNPPPQPAAKAEKPPMEEKNTPTRGPIPVLRPVLRFGDKDAGPRKAPNGRNAEDDSASHQAESRAERQSVAGGPGIPKLKEAKTLFSQKAGADPIATTAMRNIPRDDRIGRLCATELRDQLLNASPPFFPELLPFFRLKAGTVMDVPQAAFQAGGQWYDLSFRCEVDAGATKIVSFALRIGDPIPRSEWKARDLPPR